MAGIVALAGVLVLWELTLLEEAVLPRPVVFFAFALWVGLVGYCATLAGWI